MINKDDIMGNQTIQNAIVPYIETINSDKSQKKMKHSIKNYVKR